MAYWYFFSSARVGVDGVDILIVVVVGALKLVLNYDASTKFGSVLGL